MRNPHFPAQFIRPHNSMDVTHRARGLSVHGPGRPISSTHFLSHQCLRSEGLARSQARVHPRGIEYRASASARAVAMAREHPGHVLTGLSALALFGLDFFADGCDTTMHGPVERTVHATAWTPYIQRKPDARSPRDVWSVRFQGEELLVSTPPDSLIDALLHLRNHIHTWHVLTVPGLSAVEVRAVQLVDMCRRYLGIQVADIKDAARGRISRKWVGEICRRSSEKADSPKETEMRLLCANICEALGVALTEQYAVGGGPRPVTTFDLAVVDLKIAIMYDGEHHLDREQRDRDALINLECSRRGWTVLRFTAGTMREVTRLLPLLIKEAQAAQAI